MPAWAASDLANSEPQPNALDPQIGVTLDSGELFRCCLLRTLVSHTGRSYRDGGAGLQADLATQLPDVSADGLVWTFHLRRSLHYAPPFANDGGCLSRAAPQGFTADGRPGAPGLTDASTAIGRR